MLYDANMVKEAYNGVAAEEDADEKRPSLRTEIPREFIKKYLQPGDTVLDAGGGAGINAIMMAKECRHVTLFDISPAVLTLAGNNIRQAGLTHRIELLEGDIIDLSRFQNDTFTFVVCVGDAISYVLNKRFQALRELVRVAQRGSILITGCDSKYGFMCLNLGKGCLEEAIRINSMNECLDGMGSKTHLYTVDEMSAMLCDAGCEILEIASTPTFTDTIDRNLFTDEKKWAILKKLELEMCTKPELLGIGHHLLFIARKK